MTPEHHHRRACAALSHAHVLLDLRARHTISEFYTPHHAWMARYCTLMASIALHVAVSNDRQARALLGMGRPLLPPK